MSAITSSRLCCVRLICGEVEGDGHFSPRGDRALRGQLGFLVRSNAGVDIAGRGDADNSL